jgi:hypothetical protein
MRKLLIYSIITLISIVSVFLANYAMVFPIAAKVVSGIALLISLSHLLIVLFHPKGWQNKEKNFLGMWVGLLLYSMNKWISPLSMIILMNAQPFLLRWMGEDKITENTPTRFIDKWKNVSSELLWISVSYYLLDICREYTVWHVINFQLLPTILLAVVLLNRILFLKK